MAKEFITILMEEFTKVHGQMIKFKDMEFRREPIFIKDIGLRGNFMVKAICE